MTNGQYWAVLLGMLLCANITAWLDRWQRSWRRVLRLGVLGAVSGGALVAFLNRLATTPTTFINSPAFNSSDGVLLWLFPVLLVAGFVVILVSMVTSVWQAIRRHASRG